MLRRVPGPAILLPLALSAVANAQGARLESRGGRTPERCRRAAEVISSQQLSTRGHRAAIYALERCDQTGPPLLARLWLRAPVDSTVLQSLVWSSRVLRDQRTLAAVLAVAEDESRPRLVRLSALRVLATYADPAAYATLENFEPIEKWWMRPGVGRNLHAYAYDGAQPLGDGARGRILRALRRLSETSPDPRVRYAADYLHDALTGGPSPR